MISRIDHIQFVVNDPEGEARMLESLGMEIIKRVPERNTWCLRFPGENQPYIKFLPPNPDETPGLDHISFDLTDGEATREEMKRNGIRFKFEGRYVPAFGHEVSNFYGPNGILWQVTEASVTPPETAGNKED